MSDVNYTFIMEYYDPFSQRKKKYQLVYFNEDGSILIRDITAKRLFLKKMKYDIDLSSLHVGGTVTIYSRKFSITEYGDNYTKRKFEKTSESTLCVVMPGGLNFLGNIVSKFLSNGVRIARCTSIVLNRKQSTDFFGNTKTANYAEEEPMVVIEFTGNDSVNVGQNVRASIVKKYGADDVLAGTNIMYTSGSIEKASKEIDFFFQDLKRFRSSARIRNSTLCVIKPHIISSQKDYGKIIQHILDSGFDINAIDMFHLNKVDVEDFLEVYKGVVSEYEKMIDEFSSNNLIAMEISKQGVTDNSIVDKFRAICGPEDPEIAKVLRPNTLRAMFGENRVQSGVHATVLQDDAILDCEFFFKIMRN